MADEQEPLPIEMRPTSHSRMSTLAECGWKFKVKYIHRDLIEEVPMWAGVGGSAAHAATEEIDLKELWRQSGEDAT